MEKDIQDIIERQLPAQVGDVLRKRLEQAERDAVEVERLKQIVSDNKAFLEKQNARIESLDTALRRHAEIGAREEAVAKREQSIELELAKARADNAEKNKADLFGLVSIVFKSPVVKETVIKSEDVPVPSSGGYPVNMHSSSTATVERTTE